MDKLRDRVELEYSNYILELRSLSHEEIIDKSNETVIKSELRYLINEEVNDKQIEELLSKSNILDYLYQEYLKSDSINIINELRCLFD